MEWASRVQTFEFGGRLDPLFSGLPESIFHADPHAGNLMVQTHKYAPLTLVLLDWSQAGRLSAPLRHALIALCLYCVTGDEPSPEVLTRLLETNQKSIRIPLQKRFVHMQNTC